ncbi:MAG TPA: transglycosylase SLT domain-containing protein [Anaerolineales bacterium]|nr:transglycosylase SLT domain-containing protein [Anaerolineales bacterium]
MNLHRKLVWLWMIISISACQGIPTAPPTITATLTPGGPTATPTATETPTPLPTLPPVVRIDTGDEALFYGDYDSARDQYLAAYNDSTDPDLRAAALWGLGRTELADGNYQAAVERFITLITDHPESTYSARAPFLMGRAYAGLGQHDQAAASYSNYMENVPGVLDAYVQDYRGDALVEVEDYASALDAYNAALTAPRLDDGLGLQIKIAQTRASFGDFAGALILYDQIFTTTTNDYVKAQMDYLAGNAHLSLGQNDQAYARFTNAVNNYPLSYYSYLSLVALVDAGIAVDELNRGLVDYYAAQYDVALVAFDRYIAANPTNDGTAHYFRAETLRALQRFQEAVDEYDTFIENHPAHARWVDAWQDKAFLQWSALDNYQAASQTLLDYVTLAPDSGFAPDLLMDAARVLERDNRLDEAAQTWERVANEYPASEQVSYALFLAGISRYRLQDYAGALPIFQRNLLLATEAVDRARAYLWIGKTQKILGDDTSAEASWQQGVAADPAGYYGQRARDLLLGQAPFQPANNVNLNPDLEKERKEAEAWVRVSFNLPPETDLSGPDTLATDPRFIRGTELWELGMYDEARLEFESLRESVSISPTDSFRLANHLLGIGLYRTAIFAARQVLTLAGQDSQQASLTAPPYFNHLRYGLYYHDLVIAEAERYGLDPLFLFSVIRQESLFEGFVRSTAGAHGLMQVIPDTGQQIANELAWPPSYDSDDLYRPIVSVRFGSYYLTRTRDMLNGDIYAGLAAYNAGPGNAMVWQALAGGDPDLLLEIIRFEETRNYIRFISEIYSTYRTLYSPQS